MALSRHAQVLLKKNSLGELRESDKQYIGDNIPHFIFSN